MKIKLDSKKCYLLAVSGGVDSCVLFDLLIKNNINFQVVHINHHTRGLENEQEQHLVEMMCQENQIKLHLYNYRHQDGNFQQKARLFRLNNYNNIIKQEKLDGVILAHHLDDQVENILMNSKKIGYKLMEEITNYEQIKIYRPLLNYLKKEIINYAKINNIKYLEDSSNKLEKYKRNYYRLNNNLSDDEKRLLVFNEKLKKDKINYYQNLELNKKNYLNSDNQELFLYVKIKEKIKKNISKKLIDEIINNLDFCGTKSFKLPNNFYFMQVYDNLEIKQLDNQKIINCQTLKKGINVFNGIKFYANNDNGMIRTYQPNDKIKLKNGHKKINRFFIDKKIPKEKRERWPIVVNKENKIIYVPKEIK